MEKGINSYYWIGHNDYLYAKSAVDTGRNIGNYNNCVSIAAQAAEKLLKSVIEYYFAGDNSCMELMKSHNLKAIHSKIVTKYKDCPVSSKDLKWLGDFYFEARYPGENFILVTDEQDALESLRIVEALLAWIDLLPERPKAEASLEKLSDIL